MKNATTYQVIKDSSNSFFLFVRENGVIVYGASLEIKDVFFKALELSFDKLSLNHWKTTFGNPSKLYKKVIRQNGWKIIAGEKNLLKNRFSLKSLFGC